MQQVKRAALPKTASDYLNKRQAKANQKKQAGQLDIQSEWKSARKTQRMLQVLGVLQSMAGERERCMYCLDSHGADIEHFRPKAVFTEHAFNWLNLLLCCSECGRIKGDKFPLAANGRPLLIDPSKEDPWKYLEFDPTTGVLTARFDLKAGTWAPKGEKTVEALDLDKREAMARGYLTTFKRLSKIVQQALDQPPINATHFIDELRSADDHGLLAWCFSNSGKSTAPFSTLHASHSAIWRACRKAF